MDAQRGFSLSGSFSWFVVFGILAPFLYPGCDGENFGINSDRILYVSMSKASVSVTRVVRIQGDPAVWVNALVKNNSWGDIQNFQGNLTKVDFRAIAADLEARRLFFFDAVDPHLGNISSLTWLNNVTQEYTYTAPCSKQVTSFALDWVNRNLYWVDAGDEADHIALLSYDAGIPRTALIHADVPGVRAVAVDPIHRFLFWIQNFAIKRSDLKGNDVTTVIYLRRPSLLTVDSNPRLLVWLDEGSGLVETSGYEGQDRRTVWRVDTQGVGVFSAIEIYERYIFLARAESDALRNYIIDRDMKAKLKDLKVSFKDHGSGEVRSYGMAMMAPERQPKSTSMCRDRNGGCDHICVGGTSLWVQCMCSYGYSLQSDLFSCISKLVDDNFAFVTAGGVYQFDLSRGGVIALDPAFDTSPRGLDYHPAEKNVYWMDLSNRPQTSVTNLMRARLDGEGEVLHTLSQESDPYGLSLDIQKDRVYYTDAGRHLVAYIKDGKKEDVLILEEGDQPYDIVLDSHFRLMYWTTGGPRPSVERADMDDGSDRFSLVADDLGSPTGLTIDFQAQVVYWCDATRKRIEKAKLDGSVREVVVKFVGDSYLLGISMNAEYLYVLDRFKRYVTRVHRTTKVISVLKPAFLGPMENIHVYSASWNNDPSQQPSRPGRPKDSTEQTPNGGSGRPKDSTEQTPNGGSGRPKDSTEQTPNGGSGRPKDSTEQTPNGGSGRPKDSTEQTPNGGSGSDTIIIGAVSGGVILTVLIIAIGVIVAKKRCAAQPTAAPTTIQTGPIPEQEYPPMPDVYLITEPPAENTYDMIPSVNERRDQERPYLTLQDQ